MGFPEEIYSDGMFIIIMTKDTLDGITTRIHPGITGLKFVKECLGSEKPLRKMLGHIIGNSYPDLAKMKDKDMMIIAMFPGVKDVRSAMSGVNPIDLGLCRIPDEIKMESPDIDDTLLVTVVLQDSKIAFSSRIWTDKQIFVRM